MELGSRVSWTKIQGDNNTWVGKDGFGTLMSYSLGGILLIAGDCGLTTTAVKEIHEKESILVVITQNSTYEIKEYK